MEEIRKAPAIRSVPVRQNSSEYSGSVPQQRSQGKDLPDDLPDERSQALRPHQSFDKYSVILETNNQEQLIFKHAISTVVVSRPAYGSPAVHPVSATAGAPAPPPVGKQRRSDTAGRPAKKQSWRRWN